MLSSLNMLLVPAWAVALITLFPALLAGFAVGYIAYKTMLKKKGQDAETQHAKVLEEARQEGYDKGLQDVYDMMEEVNKDYSKEKEDSK